MRSGNLKCILVNLQLLKIRYSAKTTHHNQHRPTTHLTATSITFNTVSFRVRYATWIKVGYASSAPLPCMVHRSLDGINSDLPRVALPFYPLLHVSPFHNSSSFPSVFRATFSHIRSQRCAANVSEISFRILLLLQHKWQKLIIVLLL